MGIEQYGFAFFVFCLVCLALVVYSKLFSDVKRQKKLLDEKENKLLRLYQSVEEALDDFNDSVEKGLEELEQKIKAVERLPGVQETATMPPPQQQTVQQRRSAPRGGRRPMVDITVGDEEEESTLLGLTMGSGLERTSPTTADNPQDFKSLLDSVRQVEVIPSPSPSPSSGGSRPNRSKTILTLSKEGKNREQIAKELGITFSEVDLVLGMNRSSAKSSGKQQK